MNTNNSELRRSADIYSQANLKLENERFGETGGVSERNRDEGFVPAFQDTATGRVYRSCFANGNPAPIHLLDGLPADLVVERDNAAHPTAFKATLVAGFLRADRFYTRDQAAEFVTRCH